MTNYKSLDLNALILSLITINIFPLNYSRKFTRYRFTSMPIISILVVLYISLKNLSYVKYEIENIVNILIFLVSTFLISLNQSIIEENFIIF